MPVYPLVTLWGGSKNARPSDPLAIGETTVADGLQAVRCWIEIKRQPRIALHEVVNKLDHQLASSVTRREENDPALLPPPSFDQVIWTCIATIASFSMTSLCCLEAFTTSGAWCVGLLMGDANTQSPMADSKYYYSGWNAYYGASGTSAKQDEPYYGYTTNADGLGGTDTIWDIGCPNSVSSGDTLPVRNLLDEVSQGTTKVLTSSTPNESNGPYSLKSQASDGNLVLYDANGHALWSPNVTYYTSNYVVMQGDDNLVWYRGGGNTVIWQSNTSGRGYASPYAKVQNDGNFIVYGDSAHSLWASGTNWDSTNSGEFYGQTVAEGTIINSPNGN